MVNKCKVLASGIVIHAVLELAPITSPPKKKDNYSKAFPSLHKHGLWAFQNLPAPNMQGSLWRSQTLAKLAEERLAEGRPALNDDPYLNSSTLGFRV